MRDKFSCFCIYDKFLCPEHSSMVYTPFGMIAPTRHKVNIKRSID